MYLKKLSLSLSLSVSRSHAPIRFRAMFVANCHTIEDRQMRDEIGSDAVKPVACNHCNTEVGVMDEDEVYHFVGVLAGEPL